MGFNDSLSHQWMTTDVLIKTLGRYADVNTEIGKKAFAAAQDIKTFSQLMDTLKEAVGSGWAQTWEFIFGDLEQAKELWTGVSESVGGFIDRMSDFRNGILEKSLTSSWRQFLNIGVNDATGFEEEIANVARESGIAIDKMIEDNGSFEKTLKDNWLTTDILTKSMGSYLLKLHGMTDEEKKSAGITEELIEQYDDMFTSIKKGEISLDDFVNSFSKLSGRENIIEGIKNSLKGFGTYLKPISDAFSDMFGERISSLPDRIYEATKSFKELSSTFRASIKDAKNLRSTFRGLFAVIDIFRYSISSVSKFIKPLFESIGIVNSGLLKFTAGIGDGLVNIRNWIVEGDQLGKLFENMSGGLSSVLDKLRQYLSGNFDIFNEIINSKTLNEFSSKIEILKDKILDKLKKVFTNVGGFIKGHIGQILAGVSGLLTISFVRKFGKLIDALASPLDTLEKFGITVTNVIKNLGKSIKAKALETKSNAVFNFAKSLAVLAGALYLISKIPADDLWRSVGAIGALGGILLGISELSNLFDTLISKLGKNENSKLLSRSKKSLKGMLSLAIAMAIVVNTFNNIQVTDINDIGKKIFVLVDIAAILVGSAMLLGTIDKKILKSALALSSIAASFHIMIDLLTEMDSFTLNNPEKVIEIFGGVMLAISGVLLSAKHVGMGSAFTILAALIALKVMINTFKSVGDEIKGINVDENYEAIMKTLTLIGGLLLIMHAVANDSLKAAGAILLITLALLLLAPAIKSLANIKSGLIKAGLVIAGVLAMFALIIKSTERMSKHAIKAGAMITIISGAMLLLTGAIAILSQIPFWGLTQAVVAVGVLGTMFMGLIWVTKFAKKCKSELIVLTVVISLLALSIAGLSMIGDTRLGAATMALGSLMGIFTLMIYITKFAKPEKLIGPLIAMSVVIGLLGGILFALSKFTDADKTLKTAVSLSAVLLALTVSFSAISLIGKLGSKAVAVGILGLIGFIALITGLFTGLGALFNKFSSIESSIDAAIPVLDKVANGLGSFFGNIVAGFETVIADSLPGIGESLSDFADKSKPFFDAMAQVNPESLEGLKSLAEAMKIITGNDFAERIKSKIFGDNSLTNFVTSISNAIPSLKQFVEDASQLSPDEMDKSISTITKFSDVADAVKSFTIFDAIFAKPKKISKFAQSLTDIAPTLRSFPAAFNGISAEKIEEVSGMLITLSDLTNHIPSIDETVSMEVYGNRLSAFAKNISSYSDTMSGVTPESVSLGTAAASQVLDIFMESIESKNEEIYDKGDKLAAKFASGIKSGSNSYMKTTVDTLTSIIIIDLNNHYSDFSDSGKYLVEGFANGIDLYTYIAEQAGRRMAGYTKTAVNDELHNGSPSKDGMKIGRFFAQGFAIGIDQDAYKSNSASINMADGAIDGLSSAISKINSMVEDNIDSQPVIKPVLDVSGIVNSASQINAVFNKQQVLGIGVRHNYISDENKNFGETIGKEYGSIHFTQINNSPKALTRKEIYRQTKNQLSAARGFVKV